MSWEWLGFGVYVGKISVYALQSLSGFKAFPDGIYEVKFKTTVLL